MGEVKTIRLEAWGVEFVGNFNLGGDITVEITGATKDGKGQQHVIKLRACEHTLAGFVQDLRARFIQLQKSRAAQDRANLEAFKEAPE